MELYTIIIPPISSVNVQCHGVSILHPVTKKNKKIKKHKRHGKIENLIFLFSNAAIQTLFLLLLKKQCGPI
jgi:hypothetical protein